MIKNTIIFCLLFFLISCEKEQLPTLEPYIYFSEDVDYYVIDTTSSELTYSIKGSMSAELNLIQINMGDSMLTKEDIGVEQKRFMIDYPVDIATMSVPFDVSFSCKDENDNLANKLFHFIPSGPIETYRVTLGAQNNSNYGFFFSYADRAVHSISDFIAEKDNAEGFCYGYDNVNNKPYLLASTELVNQNILNQKGESISSFCQIIEVNNQPFDRTAFNSISNDAFIANLNGSAYRTFSYLEIMEDKFYLVKSGQGLIRGIIYVEKLDIGIGGSIQLIIKLQK